MTVRNQLIDLQWAQLNHDECYHKDIVLLPVATRIKHMTLHCAKYLGYFFDANESADGNRTAYVITDAFIIVLATANTLNQDLGNELGAPFNESQTLGDLGHKLSVELGRTNDVFWLIRNFARPTGQLAKLCESWDHLENIAFRNGMKECNMMLLKVLVAEAASRQIDLAQAYADRIRNVEGRSMFDRHFQNKAGT